MLPMTVDNKRRLMAAIGALPADGKPYRFIGEPVRDIRSTRANAYYHACVVDEFRKFLREQGQEFTHDDCHEFLKCKFLLQELINPATGEIVGRAPRSTASLDREEFGDFLERCIAWLADTFGVIVPEPGVYGIERPTGAKASA